MSRTSFPPLGRFKTAEQFREHWQSLAPDMDADLSVAADGPLASPLSLFGRTLNNRFVIHPMEGWDALGDGTPSPDTLRRWERFGRSGAALIWGGEAFAVSADGRANPHQLFLDESRDPEASLSQLRRAALMGRHAVGLDDEVVIGLQLTHSGRYARPTSKGAAPRTAYRHPLLDPRVGIHDDRALLTDGELEGIAERYVLAARHAASAGFDFVDVKCCHGYLLHELLSAHTRPGPYGGSLENRTRLLKRIIDQIRGECPGMGIGVRVSIVDSIPFTKGPDGVGVPEPFVADAYPFGFGVDTSDPTLPSFDDPLRFLALLSLWNVPAVNLTVGSPYYVPHLQRPAAYPPSDGYQPPEDPLLGVAYQLRATRRCKAAHKELIVVGSGYTYLQEYLANVAQYEVNAGHVDLVGLGRMVLSYPELPLDVLNGRPMTRKLVCRTFSDCTTGPRNGLPSGCYPLDPHYRARDDRELLERIKRGES